MARVTQTVERQTNLLELLSELSSNIFMCMEVNQRVESTVQTHKAPTYLMRNEDSVIPFMAYPLFGKNSWPEVEVSKYMIGDVTDREEKNQDEQQLQASLFQYFVSSLQCQ